MKKNVADMVAEARSKIEEISAKDALELAGNDDVVIVDLRDVRERQNSGFIPGSFHCPRGMAEFWIDPTSPYHKEIFSEKKKFIFHCASGWRSALTVETLQDMGLENSTHITEGFSGWVEAGGPVEK